jgi:nucleoporin NDC1
LVYIAQRFQGRRKIIFDEIDRKGGSTWSQILEVCVENITGINSRITNYLAPPPAPKAVEASQDDPGLPRLAPPLKEDNIYSPSSGPKTRSGHVAQTITSIAKAQGQSPSSSPPVLRLIDKAKAAALTPEQEKAMSTAGFWEFLRPCFLRFLQSPLGGPFRQEYRRRMAVVLLGSPYGDVGMIVDAIDAITRLAVCSLKEDSYGNVQRDLPNIIRTFTATVVRLEGFKKNLGVHWTDIEGKQESPELDTVLAVLKGGLHELLAAFGDYFDDLGLSQKDMREAREAATPVAIKSVEMKEKEK